MYIYITIYLYIFINYAVLKILSHNTDTGTLKIDIKYIYAVKIYKIIMILQIIWEFANYKKMHDLCIFSTLFKKEVTLDCNKKLPLYAH